MIYAAKHYYVADIVAAAKEAVAKAAIGGEDAAVAGTAGAQVLFDDYAFL